MTAAVTGPGTTAPSPEAHGIPSAAVLGLLDALEDGGLDPHGLVVARAGVPVVEASWAPHDAPLPGLVYSVSKTFTALAVGHLVAEGRLAVDDLVGEALGLPDPTGLTVRHLLTMSTGHTSQQLAESGAAAELTLHPHPRDPVTAVGFVPRCKTLSITIATSSMRD